MELRGKERRSSGENCRAETEAKKKTAAESFENAQIKNTPFIFEADSHFPPIFISLSQENSSYKKNPNEFPLPVCTVHMAMLYRTCLYFYRRTYIGSNIFSGPGGKRVLAPLGEVCCSRSHSPAMCRSPNIPDDDDTH